MLTWRSYLVNRAHRGPARFTTIAGCIVAISEVSGRPVPGVVPGVSDHRLTAARASSTAPGAFSILLPRFRYNGSPGPPRSSIERRRFHDSGAAILALAAALQRFVESAESEPQTPALTVPRRRRRPLPLVIVSDQEFVARRIFPTAFSLRCTKEALSALTSRTRARRSCSLRSDPRRSPGDDSLPHRSPAADADGCAGRIHQPSAGAIYDSRLDLRKPSRLLIVGDLRVARIRSDNEPLGTRAVSRSMRRREPATSVAQDASVCCEGGTQDALDCRRPSATTPISA